MDFGAQILRLYVISEEILLPFEPYTKATEKRMAGEGDIGTPSEDLNSDWSADPDLSDS